MTTQPLCPRDPSRIACRSCPLLLALMDPDLLSGSRRALQDEKDTVVAAPVSKAADADAGSAS